MDTFGLHLNLAHVCHFLGLAEEAERRCRLALTLDPRSAIAHFGLGAIYQSTDRHSEAIEAYSKAFTLAPERTDALCFIASCKLDSKDAAGAEDAARRAIAIDADNPKSWAILGMALYLQDRLAESFASFDRAEELERERGHAAETFVNDGLALLNSGRTSAALALYENLPVTRPLAHGHYAFVLMTQGRIPAGREQYEFRWFQDPFLAARKGSKHPRWNGQDLTGRTILLVAEQGAGDLIQFARFAQAVAGAGAQVVLETPPALAEFSQGFSGVHRVVTVSDRYDAHDFYVPLMSMPSARAGTRRNASLCALLSF